MILTPDTVIKLLGQVVTLSSVWYLPLSPAAICIKVAMDQHYVTDEIFDEIYKQADKTAKMISGLITYLRKNEERYKQNKLKKPDQPKK